MVTPSFPDAQLRIGDTRLRVTRNDDHSSHAMTPAEIEHIFRDEAGRVLATLIRLLGDFDRAEEARQDAFAAALEQWPERGVPDNPCAWLVQTARNKAIDHLRRESLFLGKITDLELSGTEKDAGEIEERLNSAVFGDD